MATFAKQMIGGLLGNPTTTSDNGSDSVKTESAKPAKRPSKPANQVKRPPKAADGPKPTIAKAKPSAKAAAAKEGAKKAGATELTKAAKPPNAVKTEEPLPAAASKKAGGAAGKVKAAKATAGKKPPAKAASAKSATSTALVPASTAVVPKPRRSPIAKSRRAQKLLQQSSQAFVSMINASQERKRDMYKAAAIYHRPSNHALLLNKQKGVRRMKLIDNESFVTLGHCAALETYHDLTCRSLVMGTQVHKERSLAPFQPVITRDAITAMSLELLRYVQSAAKIAADHNERRWPTAPRRPTAASV